MAERFVQRFSALFSVLAICLLPQAVLASQTTTMPAASPDACTKRVYDAVEETVRTLAQTAGTCTPGAAAGELDGETTESERLSLVGLGFLAGLAVADIMTTGGAGGSTVGLAAKGGLGSLLALGFEGFKRRTGIDDDQLYGAGVGVLAGLAAADLIGTGGLGTAMIAGLGGLVGRWMMAVGPIPATTTPP